MLVADFEEAQVAAGGTTPSLNHPITGTGTVPATDTGWHHAAATYDGTNWRLYLDGNLDGTLAVSRAPNVATAVVTAIGSSWGTAGNNPLGFFSGTIDEVRIWNTARTLAQIQASKNLEITAPTTNLIGGWNLNEGTGSNLGDSSGNAVVGTTIAAPAWVAGFDVPGNRALTLNGTSQYATVGTTTTLRSSAFTLELWFKRAAGGVTQNTGTGGVTAYPLITKGRAEAETAAADVNYFFGIDASGHLAADFEEAQVAAGGTTPSLNHPITGTGTVPATDTGWHHAAATYDGTNWRLYLDGNLDGTLAVSRAPNVATAVVTAIGSSWGTAGNNPLGFFSGTIDEVRIWNTARSLAQIQASKNLEITAPTTNLIGGWNLNEGTGSNLGDSSGNAVVGTTIAAPAWVAGFAAPGRRSECTSVGRTDQRGHRRREAAHA